MPGFQGLKGEFGDQGMTGRHGLDGIDGRKGVYSTTDWLFGQIFLL